MQGDENWEGGGEEHERGGGEPVTEEESTATTMEALKARIRELERQILRGDRYKCLICMVRMTLTQQHSADRETVEDAAAGLSQTSSALHAPPPNPSPSPNPPNSALRKPAIQSGAEVKSLGVWPGPRPLANEVRERQPKSLPLGLYCLYRGLVIGGYGSGIKRLLPQPLRRGNKKLCPQCNTITSPGDLRRVYL
ncbi:E3 ubiquitin-protein ligase Rnf220 [Liparis tanakae]|uniref:E3 ubiquitin-protein ligase Rnf220 n=1 Tax=Liparis tanakae TaxID=230148 RepID=A0A4Z2G1K1_9TELE|nr:E3 ubiquitin-protein ligase Rnf220 [Liparis tanakae]